MERNEVEAGIRAAFAGVRLGRGVSFSVAELIDDWADADIVESLAGTEPDGDRADIPAAELERADSVAHLDHDADDGPFGCGASVAVVGTIGALGQRDRHPRGFLELLTQRQRRAVALYVRALPELVELGPEDAAKMIRAWRDVWSRELDDEPRQSQAN